MKNLTKKIVYSTIYIFLFVFYAAPCFALDESALADQVAKDISEKAYSLSVNTLAFWKLTNHDKLYLDASKFQDKLDIDLLHSRSCDVVDRTNLNRMMTEMKLSTTEIIDPATMKRFGGLYGIGGFIYADTYGDVTGGDYANDYLVVKMLDTQTGQLVFGKSYRIDGVNWQTSYDIAAAKVANDIQLNADDLKAKKIKRISVWYINNPENSKIYSDKLTCALTATGLQVVDRENLTKLLEEQKFTSSELVDAKKAIEYGRIYGIDGFIYGTVEHWRGEAKGTDQIIRGGKTIDAPARENISKLTLKMIDTEKGILRWGNQLEGKLNAYDRKLYDEIQTQQNIKQNIIEADKKETRRAWAAIWYILSATSACGSVALFLTAQGPPETVWGVDEYTGEMYEVGKEPGLINEGNITGGYVTASLSLIFLLFGIICSGE